MMNEPAPTAAPSVSGDPGAAGATLLKERRRQGLSLGDISRQLKLSVRQVEALERDDYSAYKGPVFVHGFIRNYAKLLGLDPEPLIRAADVLLKPPSVASADSTTQPEVLRAPGKTGKSLPWGLIGLALFVGIAISVYFGGRPAPDSGQNAPTPVVRDNLASTKSHPETRSGAEASQPKPRVEVSKPTPKSAAKADARAESKARSESPTPSVETGVPAETGRVPTEKSAPAETGGPIAVDESERLTVRMIFEQDSWVEIKDRAGNTIFGQLNSAGSRRSVSGERPLTVVVGNAAGVRLFQGDKSIDLAPYTRVDVARLTLE